MQLTLGPCLCASHETRSSAASTCRSAVGSLASAPLAQRRSRCSSRRWSLNHRTGAFGSGSHGSHVQHRACHSRRRSLACSASPHGPEDTKTALLGAVAETDRGIFGVPAEKRKAILGLIQQLEAHGSTDGVTGRLESVAGDWRLLFSTISITGKRRTKLGLRNLISLGNFTQSIDADRKLATNQIDFNISGLGFLRGFLRIKASYEVAGPRRVSINFEKAELEPLQLQALFEQNFDLLLSIFNPAGWLDITYVDERHRVGRDDKLNVFLLERL